VSGHRVALSLVQFSVDPPGVPHDRNARAALQTVLAEASAWAKLLGHAQAGRAVGAVHFPAVHTADVVTPVQSVSTLHATQLVFVPFSGLGELQEDKTSRVASEARATRQARCTHPPAFRRFVIRAEISNASTNGSWIERLGETPQSSHPRRRTNTRPGASQSGS
jgi:hypothetical protein